MGLISVAPRSYYKLRLHYMYTSQDDKITSDALSRCQKNQKNPGPGPRDPEYMYKIVILTCVYIMKP